MRDPMTWSFPIGRMFGVNIRVHVFLPVVMLGLFLHVMASDAAKTLTNLWVDVLVVLGILFVSILLHEFGHVFGARAADGDASEILMWPLGGLAYCDVPHTPQANLITAMAGPAVNLLLCVAAGGALACATFLPPVNPFTSSPFTPVLRNWREDIVYGNRHFGGEDRIYVNRDTSAGRVREWLPADEQRIRRAEREAGKGLLPNEFAEPAKLAPWQAFAAQVFYLNWVLLLLNLLPAFPLDGGRALHCVLWWRSDYRQAMYTTAYVGFVIMLIVAIFAIAANEGGVLAMCLALIIYVNCRQQLILLETGGDETPFGYDFSQGYTSLERDQPSTAPPRRKQPNPLQRWLQKRAAKRAQRELEQREAEERRMDELLEKVQREGLQSLNDEERRFLTRVSARYRGGRS
jgi:Zn-dependent protease